MRISRRPIPALRPFVETLWAIDEGNGSARNHAVKVERVLPTGATHLVFRVSDTPLRVLGMPGVLDDPNGSAPLQTVGCAVVGGARSTFYVRDVSRPVHSVGAQFRPGAVPLLFGVPADALAGRHTRLEDLWGHAAAEARGRIAEAGSLEEELVVLESILASRLPTVRGLHPAVAEALEHFAHSADVQRAVERSGHSQRHFIELFRGAVGLGPKTFARVRRFQRALGALAPGVSLGRVALESGYSDQSHFNRDFAELAGLPPREYLRAAPASVNHVPERVRETGEIARHRSSSGCKT
jgi:AraC-like DNA-binding protein